MSTRRESVALLPTDAQNILRLNGSANPRIPLEHELYNGFQMLFNSAGYSFINLNLIILEHGHAIVESFHMSTQGFSSIKANLPDLLHTPAEGTTMACAPPLLRVEMNLLELTMMKLDCQPKPEKSRRSVANSSDDEQERLEITPENFRLSSTLLIG